MAEISEKICIMCKSSSDDKQLGGMETTATLNAHYFCLLLSASLAQNGKDSDGILGFLAEDIVLEHNRAKKLKCCYCRKNGANIGCSKKQCSRSFHLPCAINKDCRFEFFGRFASFCHSHHGIEAPAKVHATDESCHVCFDDMGEYNPVRSIQPPCCKNGWCHKICLMKYADRSGYFMKCPLCNNAELFRQHIQNFGVFIPNRDAEWEGDNEFYNFQEQSEQSHKCEAHNCKNPMGREQFDENENNEYSIVYCVHCEIKCIHKNCMLFVDFTCIECTYIILTNKDNSLGNKIADVSSTTQSNTTNSTRLDCSMDEQSASSASSIVSESSAYACDFNDDTSSNNNNNNNNDSVTNNILETAIVKIPKRKKNNRRKIRRINYDFKEAKFSINIEYCDFTKIAELANNECGTQHSSVSDDTEHNSSKKRKITG